MTFSLECVSKIPSIFFPIGGDEFYSSCVVCSVELSTIDLFWVEKQFIASEPIIEYAICEKCFDNHWKKYSEASRNAIQSYIGSHTGERLESRSDLVLDLMEASFDLEDDSSNLELSETQLAEWLDNCLIHGTPIEDSTRYQVIGRFSKDDMMLGLFPIVFCDRALNQLNELLSESTKGLVAEFVSENFGIPDEILACSPRMPVIA